MSKDFIYKSMLCFVVGLLFCFCFFIFQNIVEGTPKTNEQPTFQAEPSTVSIEDLRASIEIIIKQHEEHYNPNTYTPVWITVYGLTVAECDSDPNTGAFGPMRKYEREMALTRLVKERFNAQPRDEFLVLIPDMHEYSGIWTYWDVKPVGKGKNAFSIDLQTENSNFSGWGFIIPYKEVSYNE